MNRFTKLLLSILIICQLLCIKIYCDISVDNRTTIVSSLSGQVNNSQVDRQLKLSNVTLNITGTASKRTNNRNSTKLIFPQLFTKSDPKLFARAFGINSLMSTFLYSLSIFPLFLAITSMFSPKPHGFYGRRKRTLVNESHIYRHLPLMNRDETRRFLSLFETTLLNKKIHNENCKKYYSCRVFRDAIQNGSFPKLSDFEYALLNVFGIVVERYDHQVDLIPTVKRYYEIATNALKGISCIHKYPCADENKTASILTTNHKKGNRQRNMPASGINLLKLSRHKSDEEQ